MGREQWGHGYYKGIEAAKLNTSGLVGMYVHTYENGKIDMQLRIDKELPDSRFLLTSFSFVDGSPGPSKIYSLAELVDCSFYSTDKEMRYAWYKENQGWIKGTFEENERFM